MGWAQTNNNTPQHPGRGQILPIDAHPDVMYRPDRGIWRNRIQSYDSTFGVDSTNAITLHWLSEESYHPSQPAAETFNDMKQYWQPDKPTGGVVNPHTGTKIRVKRVNTNPYYVVVKVRASAIRPLRRRGRDQLLRWWRCKPHW